MVKRPLDEPDNGARTGNKVTTANKRHKSTHPNPSHPHGKPAPSPNPLNPLRARIRSLRRLLAHDDAFDSRQSRSLQSAPNPDPSGLHPDRAAQILHDADALEIATKHAAKDAKRAKRMPAGVRIEHERELQGLEVQVAEIMAAKRRRDMIAKWHMVRFFERRKAERRLKKVKKQEGASAAEIRDAEVAVRYAVYYPLEKAYVSLWPRKGEGEEEGPPKGDREIWKLVESCMDGGTLEDLREGRVEGCGVEQVADRGPAGTRAAHAGADKKMKTTSRDKGRQTTPQQTNDGEDDSDGGFFEE